MKKLFVLSVLLLIVLCFTSAIPVQATDVDTKTLLSTNYGWTIEGDVKDLTCPEGRELLPKEGGKMKFSWVCRHQSPWTWFAVVWRVPKGEVIEQRVNKDFVGKYDFTQACQKEKLPSAVDPEGMITECSFSMMINGNVIERFTAFYHFRVDVGLLKIPEGFALASSDGSPRKKLGFTIWMWSGNSNRKVGGELREIVGKMRLVPPASCGEPVRKSRDSQCRFVQ